MSFFAPGKQHVGEQAPNIPKQRYNKSNGQPSFSLHALMLALAEPLSVSAAFFVGLKLLADCNTRNQSGSSTTAHLSNPSLKPGAAACFLNTLQYCFTSQLNWISVLLRHLSMPVLCFLLSRVIAFFFSPRAYQLLQYSR